MTRWSRFGSVVGGRRLIVALGAFYVVIAVLWAVVVAPPEQALSSRLVVSGFVGGSGAILLAGGYRLPRTDIHRRFYGVIAGWCLVGIVVMLGVLTLYHLQPDTGISEPSRSVPILTGFSAVAGFGVGTYGARAKTHAYRLERQNQVLEQTQARLEEANERLEQFTYAASHDLKEPLRLVTSYLELVEREAGDDLDDDAREYLEDAIDSSTRMSEMIEGLLEYSLMETEGEPLEPVDLEAVLDDVRDDLRMQITESDATIDVEALPRVEGDANQLRQLFQNLLSNAITYSGDEPPQIEVSAERDGDEWLISVRDEGVGIEPSAQDRIFELFKRADSSDAHAGTGIGLAVCERIVTRHGGDIWVDSEPGEGTTFSLTLPVAAAPDREQERGDAPPSASVSTDADEGSPGSAC